jgi:hypothetical protein
LKTLSVPTPERQSKQGKNLGVFQFEFLLTLFSALAFIEASIISVSKEFVHQYAKAASKQRVYDEHNKANCRSAL